MYFKISFRFFSSGLENFLIDYFVSLNESSHEDLPCLTPGVSLHLQHMYTAPLTHQPSSLWWVRSRTRDEIRRYFRCRVWRCHVLYGYSLTFEHWLGCSVLSGHIHPQVTKKKAVSEIKYGKWRFSWVWLKMQDCKHYLKVSYWLLWM